MWGPASKTLQRSCGTWPNVKVRRSISKSTTTNDVVGCVVVLTGPTDYISDGTSVAVLRNGDDVLGRITGSGCILGSIIASFCATASQIARADASNAHDSAELFRGDVFSAAIAG